MRISPLNLIVMAHTLDVEGLDRERILKRCQLDPASLLNEDGEWVPAEHFAERYFHKYADLDTIKADGANVVNIHHATPINPWINYPFLAVPAMRARGFTPETRVMIASAVTTWSSWSGCRP